MNIDVISKFLKKNYLVSIILIIFISFVIITRKNLDKDHIFIASDAQIKFYQTIQSKDKNLLNIDCLYPGKDKDPEYNYYPIRYPWTIIDNNKNTCVYEYPPFFPLLGSIMMSLLGNYGALYLPIVFYIFSGLTFLNIVLKNTQNRLIPSIFFILSFVSFPLLTSMDYSESPLYHFFILFGLLIYFHFKIPMKWKIFLFGFFLGISILFRMEILIPASTICLLFFLYKDSFINRIKKSILFGLGFSLPVICFLFYNFIVSGHILGYRFISSLLENRISNPSIQFKLLLLKAYLFGDSVMVGLFGFHPFLVIIILILLYSCLKSRLKENESILFLTGIISIIAIPLSINFYGGVGYFGLRYLETPFLFVMISFALFLNRNFNNNPKSIKLILSLILIFSLIINYKNTKEGLKVLKNGAKDYQSFQSSIQLEKDSIIIHTSLYTSIFIGESLLKFPNYHIKSADEINKFLQKFPNHIDIILLFPPQKMYISADIPLNLISNYDSKVNPKDININILNENLISGVRIIHAKFQ